MPIVLLNDKVCKMLSIHIAQKVRFITEMDDDGLYLVFLMFKHNDLIFERRIKVIDINEIPDYDMKSARNYLDSIKSSNIIDYTEIKEKVQNEIKQFKRVK